MGLDGKGCDEWWEGVVVVQGERRRRRKKAAKERQTDEANRKTSKQKAGNTIIEYSNVFDIIFEANNSNTIAITPLQKPNNSEQTHCKKSKKSP